MSKRDKKASYFYRKLREHLDADPSDLKIVGQHFETYQEVNLHLAIESLLAMEGMSHELVGVVRVQEYNAISLAKISRRATAEKFMRGPVEYKDLAMGPAERISCVSQGVYWIKTSKGPIVLLIAPAPHSYPPTISVEIMGVDSDVAQFFSRELTLRVNDAPAFKGKILSLEMDCHRQLTVRYHSLPSIRADNVILPAELLQRLERQTTGFVRHAARFKQTNRHMKRGVLLHGPPGTGKTLSAMFITSQMPGRTVLILTGGGISAIEATGQLARAIQPATVILEDVDLIGTMREHQDVGANALLFELLNQMDGLAEDADVLFILTTNRPDIIEPALVSRPGRIDQAIHIPLPDAECRRKLIALYSDKLPTEITDLNAMIEKTEGVSAAFIRELMRRATLLAAEKDGDELIVRDEELNQAFDELTIAGGNLTKRLLGATVE